MKKFNILDRYRVIFDCNKFVTKFVTCNKFLLHGISSSKCWNFTQNISVWHKWTTQTVPDCKYISILDVTSFLSDVTNFVTNFVTGFVTRMHTSLGITFVFRNVSIVNSECSDDSGMSRNMLGRPNYQNWSVFDRFWRCERRYRSDRDLKNRNLKKSITNMKTWEPQLSETPKIIT